MIYDDLAREWFRRPHKPAEKISLLVPFRTDNAERQRNWTWLLAYWRAALPEAEIVVGTDNSVPFCKTAAVNRAFARSTGDVIVILDADCYISADTIRECARRIRIARALHHTLWYMPYKRFYRLTEDASMRLLSTPPDAPMIFGDPPPPADLDPSGGVSYGHWYGALIQMMPREAFESVGDMDERFQGWGGEDVSFMFALDTLFGRHRIYNGPVYHVHHPTIKGRWLRTRQWAGQDKPETNDWLSTKYEDAFNDRMRMRKLIDGR